LQPGSQNMFTIADDKCRSYLRLNIFPDGGVARFRAYGNVTPNPHLFQPDSLMDLVAMANGGRVITCSNMFFSSKDNLIKPGSSINMGDGWETKRKRASGNDWAIIKLATSGNIHKVEVDTAHFKGNYPDQCSLEGCYLDDFFYVSTLSSDIKWEEILPQTKLEADTQHYFEKELRVSGPFTHVRLNIFPDGGVARLRVYGYMEKHDLKKLRELNKRTDKAKEKLYHCCGASRWVEEMMGKRPFSDKEQLFSLAREIWNNLTPDDWREAFTHHPKIGDIENLRKKFVATSKWASQEQAGTKAASESVLGELARLNQVYEEKFGYIFIVCATGKNAEEMLRLLKKRFENNPDDEIKIAAGEQEKITRIRLEKLLSE